MQFHREYATRTIERVLRKKEEEKQRLSSPPSVLSGADENWQRSFREGRQWAQIVKTSLPNHGGREQRQSPPLLRGHKLIRRGKGAAQVFSPRNAACRQSRANKESGCYIPVPRKARFEVDRIWFDMIWLVNGLILFIYKFFNIQILHKIISLYFMLFTVKRWY